MEKRFKIKMAKEIKQITEEDITRNFDRYLTIVKGIDKSRVEVSRENKEYIEGIYHTLVTEFKNVSYENKIKAIEVVGRVKYLLGEDSKDINWDIPNNRFYLPNPITTKIPEAKLYHSVN